MDPTVNWNTVRTRKEIKKKIAILNTAKPNVLDTDNYLY